MDSRHRKTGWSTVLIWMLCTSLAADEGAPDATHPSDWSIAGWNLQISLYTKHFDPDPEHVNHQKLIGFEAVFANDWLTGLAVFDNSFGQNSQFLYMGKTWQVGESRFWYLKLMGGLLHGYKEPYDDKIPFNGMGVAPAIVPALGFKYKWFRAEVHLAGLAAMTITAGIRF